MERFRCSKYQNDCKKLPKMTGYLNVALLAPWWQKIELKD